MQTYTIQGVDLILQPLKVKHFRALLHVMAGLDFANKDLSTVKPTEIIDAMLGAAISDAAAAIFGDDAKKIDWEDVEIAEVEAIVRDFFGLNPRLIEIFSAFSLNSVSAAAD